MEGSAEILEIKKQLRSIETSFSDDDTYMKDVQLVIDENYINYILLDFFFGTETISLLERMISWWPEGLYGGTVAIKGLMNTGIWGVLFHDLAWYPPQT